MISFLLPCVIFSCLAQQKFDTIPAFLFGSAVNFGSAAMLNTAQHF